MFWRLGAGYVWGFSSWAIGLRQSHILCNRFHPRHNHVLCQYTGSKTSMTRKWCFVVFGRQQTWNIPNHEPYLCADCGFQRQEHGDSWMVPTTQMFWLQRRWFCQTVGRITPEVPKSFCIVITCFATTAMVEFPNSIFWQFAHWRVLVKESLLQYYRLVSTIQYFGHLIISQTGFENDHYYHWFCNNRELDVSFSLEIQYLATFGRYLGGADFYSPKVIIWWLGQEWILKPMLER